MFRFLKDMILGKKKIPENKELKQYITTSLSKNISLFKELFRDDNTIIFREVITANNFRCYMIFADGMIKASVINENIIERIMANSVPSGLIGQNALNYFKSKVIAIEAVECTGELERIASSILYGDTFFMIEGVAEGLILNTKGWESRSIISPESQKVVRGPREGFTESIMKNISLLRRKIKNPKLKFIYKTLGVQTQTTLAISYVEGLVNEKILEEVKSRLDTIKIDGLLDTKYIEELITDSPLTPFKTIGHTERPDIVAGKLLEGRIAIIMDGTPFVLTIPFIFTEYFQTNEDYYQNYFYASLNRLIRYIAFFLTTSTPAIYLALITYHQEMIPTQLLLSISASRQGVPFPTVIEATLLGFLFELLREGGTRLPTPIGQAISIVGAIILGEAAVAAKFASAPQIIVTALTGLSGFLLPYMLGVVIFLRLIFLLLASFFGLYGYMFGVIGLFIQLMSMRSFGVPYMLTWGSFNPSDIKDTTMRAPWWFMYMRPKFIGSNNRFREPGIIFPRKKGPK